MARALLFEYTTCSRCGGSGEYSYCQMYGRTCFKCHGAGNMLTKRGAAAQSWFNAQKTKPLSEVKVGDKVVMDGVPGFSKSQVVTVTSVGWGDKPSWLDQKTGEWKPHFVLDGVTKTGESSSLHAFPDTPVKLHVWGEAKAALIAEALAYQSTLTKSGTVAKAAAKAAA